MSPELHLAWEVMKWPLAACLVLPPLLVYMGLHVVRREVIFVDLALAQVATLGFRPIVVRRLLCLTLFWHALDIIWVALFTVVYLMGVRP